MQATEPAPQQERAERAPRPRMSAQQTFAALRHRNYRLWFTGQAFSLIGTWMQSTAQGFLVYQLTNSPAYLGYVGFASGIKEREREALTRKLEPLINPPGFTGRAGVAARKAHDATPGGARASVP